MFLFVVANLGVKFTLLFCQLVILKFIPPDLIGIWQLAIVINTYCLFSNLGIIGAMNREYPYFLGKGDTLTAKSVVNTAHAYSLLNGLVIATIFLVAALIVAEKGQQWWIAFVTMAVVAPLQLYAGYLEGTYRSSDDFGKLSCRKILLIPVYIITIILPWKLGFNGFLIRELFLAGFYTFIYYLARPVKVCWSFNIDVFKLLFATGWRLFTRNYSVKVAASFPRLVLVSFSGVASLGLFTPVSWMFTAVSGIAASFGIYLYPKLTYRYAQKNSPLDKVAIKASLSAMLFLLPGVILGVCVLPWLIQTLMPQYIPATRAAQVTLVASLLECMSVATIIFASLKAWRVMFIYTASTLVLRFIGAWGGFYALQDPLLGVACGMLVTSIVMCPFTWWTVHLASRNASLKMKGQVFYENVP